MDRTGARAGGGRPCPDCGAKLPPGAYLCTSCGAWRPYRTRVRSTAPLTEPTRMPPDLRLILRVALLIVALGVAGAFAHTRGVLRLARAVPTSSSPATPATLPADSTLTRAR
ncbi:hypothetical protein rosag_13550 [Roseisolibacter agri]|uniref:Zinc-ribbon domain-containing protein n=2 Tax=Roseisolibacter agri TaxID=2014610 RepID=A0AA37Q6X2_9BACT|nr:hypothetical protein rosag_13550 [Roseisolibacter agri]